MCLNKNNNPYNPAIISYDIYCVVHDVHLTASIITDSTSFVAHAQLEWCAYYIIIAYVFLCAISKFLHFSWIPICDTETTCPSVQRTMILAPFAMEWFCFCYTKTFDTTFRSIHKQI